MTPKVFPCGDCLKEVKTLGKGRLLMSQNMLRGRSLDIQEEKEYPGSALKQKKVYWLRDGRKYLFLGDLHN